MSVTVLRCLLALGIIGHAVNMYCDRIISIFSSLKVTDKETEALTGSTVTSFRFCLLDGTNYEIIYNAKGVKSGRVQLGEETKDYFTSADIGSLWDNCQQEAVKVNESELPVCS